MSEVGGSAALTNDGLPPAAVEITEYRRALDRARLPGNARRHPFFAWWIVVAALGVIAMVALVIVAPGDRVPLAGATVCLVLTLGLVVASGMSASRRRQRASVEVAAELDLTVARVTTHLASIGYAVPADTALDWVSSPESTATVPLVHDSVIAARWWHPAPGDERVFVEPFLRQDGRESSLPPLAPLKPEPTAT